MITPSKKFAKASTDFVVCDIENWPDGSVIHIGTSWRESADDYEIQHRVDNSWGEWWDFIRVESRKHKRFRRIYAHNGGGWDWVSFCEYIIKSGGIKSEFISIARAMSKMIVMSITVGERYTIQFCDSLYLLRSTLKDLSKVFGLEGGKQDLEGKLPHEIFLTDPGRYFRYLKADCESLLLVLEKSLEMLRRIAPIGKLGATIGSTAMLVFRTGFLSTPISIPESTEEKLFLREGYRGGRVEVFRYGLFSDISVYDINSLYPTAMVSTSIPISGRMLPCDLFREKMVGCYRIRWSQKRREIPPIFLQNGVGKYDGDGVYFSPEIALFKELNAGTIQVTEGYIFPDTGQPFNDYVFSLYKLRQDNPDSAISLMAKYLLNSLYGKMGQNAVRENIIWYETKTQKIAALRKLARNRKRNRRMHTLSEDGLICAVEESTEVSFEHVGIAGIITSQARVLLYRMILEAGSENVVYSDTDSVHCFGRKLDRFVGIDLGMVKVEARGDGVYCGKKLYAIRERLKKKYDNGSEIGYIKRKVRAKGVSVGNRNGCKLDFDDMVRISKGAVIECEFSQPASILDVLKGKDSSCRIGAKNGGHNRHRKLRKT